MSGGGNPPAPPRTGTGPGGAPPLPGTLGAGRPGGAGGARPAAAAGGGAAGPPVLLLGAGLGIPPGEGGLGEGADARNQSSLTGGGAGEYVVCIDTSPIIRNASLHA